jgi:hypothetical protein
MNINDLFDGIMKSINQFTEGCSRMSCASKHSNIPVHQIAEQRLQDKNAKATQVADNKQEKTNRSNNRTRLVDRFVFTGGATGVE